MGIFKHQSDKTNQPDQPNTNKTIEQTDNSMLPVVRDPTPVDLVAFRTGLAGTSPQVHGYGESRALKERSIVGRIVDYVIGSPDEVGGNRLRYTDIASDPFKAVFVLNSKTIATFCDSLIPLELLNPLPDQEKEANGLGNWKKYVELDASEIKTIDRDHNKIVLVDKINSRTIYLALCTLTAGMPDNSLRIILEVAKNVGLGASMTFAEDGMPVLDKIGLAKGQEFVKEVAGMVVHFTNYSFADRFIVEVMHHKPSESQFTPNDISMFVPADLTFKKETFINNAFNKPVRALGFDSSKRADGKLDVRFIKTTHDIDTPAEDGCVIAPDHIAFSIDSLENWPKEIDPHKVADKVKMLKLGGSIGMDEDSRRQIASCSHDPDLTASIYAEIELIYAQLLSGGPLPFGSDKYFNNKQYQARYGARNSQIVEEIVSSDGIRDHAAMNTITALFTDQEMRQLKQKLRTDRLW